MPVERLRMNRFFYDHKAPGLYQANLGCARHRIQCERLAFAGLQHVYRDGLASIVALYNYAGCSAESRYGRLSVIVVLLPDTTADIVAGANSSCQATYISRSIPLRRYESPWTIAVGIGTREPAQVIIERPYRSTRPGNRIGENPA